MRAIVLKKNLFDEGSEIITVYSRELGKIRAVARAVKSPKSKLAHALDTLFYSELDILPNRKLPTIIGAKPVNTFKNLRADVSKVYAALFATELLLKSTADEEPNHALFEDFLNLLEHLDLAADQEPPTASSDVHLCAEAFAIRLLSHNGYGLTFGPCGICGKQLGAEVSEASEVAETAQATPPASQEIFFNARKGGFICGGCSLKAFNAQPIAAELYGFLEASTQNTYEQLDQSTVSPKLARSFVEAFVFHVLERNLNAAKYLATLR